MKRPQVGARTPLKAQAGGRRSPATTVLAPLALGLCLALAFPPAAALQGEHAAEHQAAGAAPTGPMLSMGSESSSALESSAALAGDDLMAAESSQTPDAAEHKSFTSAQVMRQDPQQMAASVAPVVYQPQQQPAVQPQQQHQLFNMHQQQQQQPAQHPLAMQARMQHPAQKFNPFMAAALAGNYGPAQQQLAAAAIQQQQHHVGPHHAPLAGLPMHPQQQQQQHGQLHHQVAHHHAAPFPQQMVRAPAKAEAPQVAHQPMAVQESSVRSNMVPPPPPFAAADASNAIDDSPGAAPPSQQATGSSQMVSAASGQHPVISSASSAMVEAGASAWPLQPPDIPKIVNLEVKCEKNLMKVSVEFDKLFNGVIFSKGHYSQGQCIHVQHNSGKQQAYFDISINSCGTQGNTQNGLYGMGGNTGSGTYFENTIVIQYDPNVQEVYDHARKLRCTWHDQYEKAVTFRPFPVDMLDIVRADFAGDNVGCWMQIQVGKGPWASEVAGIVKIGQTMTMVLAIKDEENKFDMLVRNCFAHDGKRGPIELVDKSGCITRPKLMSKFTKIKNFGSSATVLSYAHFQAFKFPDSMEVHFQCTIQICRHQCPEQCSAAGASAIGGPGESYSESTISGTFNINGRDNQPAGESSLHLRKFGASTREKRDLQHQHHNGSQPHRFTVKPMSQTVGLNRVIQVVSSGDLAFAIQQQQAAQQQQQLVNGSFELDSPQGTAAALSARVDLSSQICMSSYNFVLALVLLVLVLLCSCLAAVGLYLRQRSLSKQRAGKLLLVPAHHQSPSSSACSSPSATMRPAQQQVPTTKSNYLHHNTNYHLYAQ